MINVDFSPHIIQDCGINHSEREEMTDCFSSVVDPGRDQGCNNLQQTSLITKRKQCTCVRACVGGIYVRM